MRGLEPARKKKAKFREPVREWDPRAVRPAAQPTPPPTPKTPSPTTRDLTGYGDYTFFHGILTFIAIATVAVAGLTFIQHGNVEYVIAGLAAGGILYGVTEWLMPLKDAPGDPNDLKNPQQSNKGNYEEG
jgi:hypothetical protein